VAAVGLVDFCVEYYWFWRVFCAEFAEGLLYL